MPRTSTGVNFLFVNNVTYPSYVMDLGLTSADMQTTLPLILFYETIAKTACYDSNGDLIVKIFYSNEEDMFSLAFRYGSEDYNQNPTCFKIEPIMVTLPDVTPIWPQ